MTSNDKPVFTEAEPLSEAQLKMVEDAIDNCYPAGKQSKVKRRLLAELTKPKEPEFTDKQVVHVAYGRGYRRFENAGHYRVRPLNQTEVGPNWIPKQDAIDQAVAGKVLGIAAQAVLDDFDRYMTGSPNGLFGKSMPELKKAKFKFDAATKGESDE